MEKIKLAGIGCGNRTDTYMNLAMKLMPQNFDITALADPIKERRDIISSYQSGNKIKHFDSARSFLKEDKLADVVIIGTQDDYHFEPALAAIEKGYDLILEKPISNKLEEVLVLNKHATELNRKVIICHVLRYAPFYIKVREILKSGIVGEIVSLNATEGVGAWHQAHSYVRGKWSDTSISSPMILAKSCHDMDIISWLVGQKCLSISSFGELSHFCMSNAPAGAPGRCTDGCPVADSCQYNAMLYLTERRDPWLEVVFDREKTQLAKGGASDEEIIQWLKTSPWGRCVYACNNDAVDHQVVNFKFEKNITATFTMTAFDEGRNIEIFGTKGTLKGGEFVKKITGHDLVFYDNRNGTVQYWDIEFDPDGNASHGGGDSGFIQELYNEIKNDNPSDMKSSIQNSVESHVMACAAEESRRTNKVINLAEYQKEILQGISK